FEVPASFVELGDAAVVKDRPFERERLARREAAFGASLVFELLAITVEGKEGHGFLHWFSKPDRSFGAMGKVTNTRSARWRAAVAATRSCVLCSSHDGTDFGWNKDPR